MRAAALVLCLLLVSACNQRAVPSHEAYPSLPVFGPLAHSLQYSCVANYQPGVNYFPQRTEFRWSNQLSVEYGANYKHVRFVPGVDTGETLDILMVQCGTPVPEHAPGTIVIEVPIQRLATGNSAMLGAADELDMVELLVGIENVRSPTVPSVRKRVREGKIVELWGTANANIEPVIAVQPDVYLSFYSAYPQFNLHPQLRRIGVRALPQADHLERHPLGRAEWIKLLAMLANREQQANQRFAQIEQDYLALVRLTQQASVQPLVMAGYPAGRDSFEVFGGLNQRAQLIMDAGGRYVLADSTQTGSLVYASFEHVYALGARAPAWLGAQPGHASLAELTASTPRAGWFRAVEEGNVWAFDKGYLGAWASPYHDNGMTRPHLALQDAVRALHPDLLPAAKPSTFLRRLP